MTDGRSWRNRTPGLGTSASFPKLPVLSACRHPRDDETEYAADRWARFIRLLKREVCDARAGAIAAGAGNATLILLREQLERGAAN